MRPSRALNAARGPRWLLLLWTALLAACADGSNPRPADATAADAGMRDDLGGDSMDAPAADVLAGDLGAADVAADRTHDAGADGGTDATVPDVPGVMMAGFFIPVDPDAVPPPGSECVGDGGVRAGDPTIAPPRPIRPLSVSRVTSQRPTFQWVLPEGTTGARVEVCADRCCTRVLQTFDAEGTTTRPATPLPPGVVFWRMFGRRGTVVGSRASYTWEFGVRRRDAPNDTTWGTIRDFNGDGYDDLVVVAQQTATDDRTSEVLLVPGSARGLQPPLRTGFTNPRLPDFASVGDFNGDGLADIAWENRIADTSFEPGWVDVIHGTPAGLRQVARLEYHRIAGCASPALPSATDWDGDGYSDIIVSVGMRCDRFEPPVAYFLFIYRGSGRGLPAVPQAVVRTDQRFLHPASFVQHALGDVDLDGYGDAFLVSRFTGSGTTSVRAESFVAYGSPAGPLRYDRVTGVSERGIVRPLGDLDGDGHIDWSLWLQGTGALRVYRHSGGYMAPSDILRDTVAVFPGGQFAADGRNDGGDINGDGLSDVIVSAENAHDEVRDGIPVDMGRTYVYPGTIGRLSQTPTVVIRPPRAEGGEAQMRYFGWSAMSPGDVNGDGIDDMVMGDEIGNSLCFSFGRIGTTATRPDGCVSGWWPTYERYL